MPDHTVTFTDRQENAAQSLVDILNAARAADDKTPWTIDTWLRKLALEPIRVRIAEQDADKIAPIVSALPNATNVQINQVKALLGIV